MVPDATIPLDPSNDEFGAQVQTVTQFGDSNRTTLGIFDTGASPITVSPDDQAAFSDVIGNPAPIPILVPGGAAGDGIGGSVTGDVSEPITVLTDGLHAASADFNFDNFSLAFGGSFDENSARLDGAQVFVGTPDGSPDLPTISGTPIFAGGFNSASTSSLAARVDLANGVDFYGLGFTEPDLHFVPTGTSLQPAAGEPQATIPLVPIGGSTVSAPGQDISSHFNYTVNSVGLADGGGSVGDQHFLFDTGAELTVISTAEAQALHLDQTTPFDSIDVQGVGGSQTVNGYILDSLSVTQTDGSTLTFTHVPVFVLDVAPGQIDGILGMNLWNRVDQMLVDPNARTGSETTPSLSISWDPNASAGFGDGFAFLLNSKLYGRASNLSLVQLLGDAGRAVQIPANRPPTLDSIANPAAIAENAGTQTVTLSGITAGAGERQALMVTAVSSNAALIPNPTITYTSPHTTGSLGYKPAPGVSGSAQITVTVTDSGGTARGGVNTVTRTFIVSVTPPPIVADFGPLSGPPGTQVTIDGSNFAGATAISFAGVGASSFTVTSANRITATVPAGAISGAIAVTTPGGTTVSGAAFAVILPPVVSGFSPGAGTAGSQIIITGSNFTGATAVLFGGVAAANFSVDSAGQISVTVPVGAVTGFISVSTPAGVVVSNVSFTVTEPPPAPIHDGIFVTGADAGGGPNVVVRDAVTQAVLFNFMAYDLGFTGGVRVAVGDVNGDGVPEIITATGPGGGPDIHVYDGTSGMPIRQFFAYDSNFTGGVYVAAGDVNGDGFADIICGADAGGGPNVTVFSGKDGSRLLSFFPYDPHFTGGVRVAAGDTTGTGVASIITGAGAGGGPNVTVFQYANGDASRLQSYFAYDPHFSAGIYVSSGDVNGDGHADVIVGAGAGGGPNVAVFSGVDSIGLARYFPLDPAFSGGIRVAAVDSGGRGGANVISVAGPGGGPEVGIVSLTDPLRPQQIDQFFAYAPQFTGGLFVAAGR